MSIEQETALQGLNGLVETMRSSFAEALDDLPRKRPRSDSETEGGNKRHETTEVLEGLSKPKIEPVASQEERKLLSCTASQLALMRFSQEVLLEVFDQDLVSDFEFSDMEDVDYSEMRQTVKDVQSLLTDIQRNLRNAKRSEFALSALQNLFKGNFDEGSFHILQKTKLPKVLQSIGKETPHQPIRQQIRDFLGYLRQQAKQLPLTAQPAADSFEKYHSALQIAHKKANDAEILKALRQLFDIDFLKLTQEKAGSLNAVQETLAKIMQNTKNTEIKQKVEGFNRKWKEAQSRGTIV